MYMQCWGAGTFFSPAPSSWLWVLAPAPTKKRLRSRFQAPWRHFYKFLLMAPALKRLGFLTLAPGSWEAFLGDFYWLWFQHGTPLKGLGFRIQFPNTGILYILFYPPFYIISQCTFFPAVPGNFIFN